MKQKFGSQRCDYATGVRSLAIAVSLFAIHGAQAQETVSNSGLAKLDTLVVTATRAHDRTVLDSASSIDVITAELLRAASAINGELGQSLQTIQRRSVSTAPASKRACASRLGRTIKEDHARARANALLFCRAKRGRFAGFVSIVRSPTAEARCAQIPLLPTPGSA